LSLANADAELLVGRHLERDRQIAVGPFTSHEITGKSLMMRADASGLEIVERR